MEFSCLVDMTTATPGKMDFSWGNNELVWLCKFPPKVFSEKNIRERVTPVVAYCSVSARMTCALPLTRQLQKKIWSGVLSDAKDDCIVCSSFPASLLVPFWTSAADPESTPSIAVESKLSTVSDVVFGVADSAPSLSRALMMSDRLLTLSVLAAGLWTRFRFAIVG